MNPIAGERGRAGLSQEQLANELGVKSRATISAWEKGEADIPSSMLVKMSKFFRCSTDYLLGLTEERKAIA